MSFVHLTRLVGPVVFGAIGSALGLTATFVVNAAVMAGGGLLSRPRATRPPPDTAP